jgi:hypothetical protein
MPRTAMDYAKVIIYHFVCRDPSQVAQYVGSTTNFIKRKAHHKCVCNRPSHKAYHRSIYQTIRDNGGWDNWEMKPLEEFPCENHIQQQIREQYWLDKLSPTLNMNKAYIEDKVAYKKAYYEANIEACKERMKAYYEANKETLNERAKAYYEANKEELRSYQKAYQARKRELKSNDTL